VPKSPANDTIGRAARLTSWRPREIVALQRELITPRVASRSGAEAREGWQFLLRSVGDNWGPLGASFVAALVWTAVVVAVPELIGAAVNAGIIGHDERRFAFLTALIALLALVQAVSSGLRRWTNGLASRRLEAELRQRFFAKLLRLEIAFHDQVNRGQLLSRLTSDLFQIQAFVSSGPAWIANVIVVTAVSVVLLTTNPLLGAVTLVGLPFVGFGSKVFSALIRSSIADLQRERGELAGVVEEAVTGVRAVKGFGSESLLRRRLGAQADRVRARALELVALRTTFVPVVSTVPLLELAVLNWIGGVLVLHHELSVGTLLAFNAYVGLIAPPVQSIGGYIVLGQRAIVSSRRLHSVMRRTPAIGEPKGAVPLPGGPGALSFEHVGFAYPEAATPVFDGLELAIGGGEVVALVGPTGSGKSTLLALISRLYDPASGVVRLDGADLRRVSLKALRAATAVVFEDNFLFDDSIRANICLGRTDVSAHRLSEVLRLARAEEFVAALPDGVDTVVGERGLSLSGGQRQRLALARALMSEPRVLMLDDATSAIDAANERAIVAGLARARRGRTTIIVSHRPATIAAADRVVLLDGGAVVATGTHDELLGSCPRYLEVLGAGDYDRDDETGERRQRPEESAASAVGGGEAAAGENVPGHRHPAGHGGSGDEGQEASLVGRDRRAPEVGKGAA
jgi:ATP-binding cassette subfamily B protein